MQYILQTKALSIDTAPVLKRPLTFHRVFTSVIVQDGSRRAAGACTGWPGRGGEEEGLEDLRQQVADNPRPRGVPLPLCVDQQHVEADPGGAQAGGPEEGQVEEGQACCGGGGGGRVR